MCCKTRYDGNSCGTHESAGMEHDIKYDVNDTIVIEYRDINNKYIADVAIINEGKVKYIFEIKNTHSTTTDVRPEPWFEINAQEILEDENNEEGDIYLTCIRNNKNRYCSNCRIIDEEWVNNLPMLYIINGTKAGLATLENPCIKCARTAYNPVFKRGYRQLCKICLSICENELKKEYNTKYKCLIKL